MVFAAEFCTLSPVNSRLIDNGPGFMNKSRNRIFLDSEIGHPPGVNNIVGSDQEANALIDRNDQGFVHVQEIIFSLIRTVIDFILRCEQGVSEGVVAPEPWLAA